MKFSRPLWNPVWGGFFLRVPLGLYLLWLGKYQLEQKNLDAFIALVKKYEVMPDQVATLYAVTIPFLELIAGGLLVLGFWTSLGAIITVLILASFLYIIGITPTEAGLFNKDMVFLGAALSLLSTGGGAFSIDNFRTKG